MPDPRAACIIGVGQRTWHLAGDQQSPEPLDMAGEVVRTAAGDAGARGDVLAAVDSLDVVYCMSWPYDDLPGRLADNLGIDPRRRHYSGIGGVVPQLLVSGAARAIAAGELDVAVVVGAEALDTKRRLRKAGERPAWSHRHPHPEPMPFEAPFHPAEVAHEVFQAWLTFAVRDVARRAHLDIAPDGYRNRIGELLAPLTEVAADNPHAWFPQVRTAEDLVTPSAANRMVGYPYTKLTISVMDVDMAAAVVVASHAAADQLGVPAERRVYLRGTGEAYDAVYVAEHPELWRSPAMTAALGDALASGGSGIDDVAHLDLYSCFASSLWFATDALGLDPRADGRSLTVTGGLPFAGGPASNYLSHSLATMVGVLRADPGSLGLVSGVGMHMTKHAAGVYSTDPPGRPRRAAVSAPPVRAVPIVDRYDGPASIAAYSVVHGRDGAPHWGVVIVDIDAGSGRAYGRVDDADALAALEAEEQVGSLVTLVTASGGVNRVSGVGDTATHPAARRRA